MPRLKTFDYEARADAAYSDWVYALPPVMAFDTETTGVQWHDKPFCVTVAFQDCMGTLVSHFFDLSSKWAWEYLPVMLRDTPTIIGHNTKFDLQKLILVGLLNREDLDENRIEDTLAMGHLLDENRSNKLKDLAQSVLGRTTDEDAKLKVVRRKLKLKKDDGYEPIPRHILVPYALADAEMTFDLWHTLKPQLEQWPELKELYRLEMELLLVTLDMEAAGMGVDTEYVETKVKELGGQILRTERRIAGLVGRPVGRGKDEFNPASPKQILEAFADRGVDLEGTSEAVLSGLRDEQLAVCLLELRKANKLRSTYLIPILNETKDGVIHTSFRNTGTRTGRFSSGSQRPDG